MATPKAAAKAYRKAAGPLPPKIYVVPDGRTKIWAPFLSRARRPINKI